MQPVVVVYGQDLGGVRVLLPVIKRLIRDRSFRLRVIGTDEAGEIFRSGGITCQDLQSLGYQVPLSDAAALKLLRSLAPDLFLGGASHYRNPTNARLVTACRKLGIPTVALLDHWKNLDRFDGPTTRGFRFAPDILGVMDERTRNALQGFGFCADRLYVVGHPYLQQIYGARRRHLQRDRVAAVKQRVGVPAEGLLILCCSEMLHVHGISESCGPRCRPLFRVGDGDVTLLDRVRNTAQRVERRTGRACVVALRPHPFEKNRPGFSGYPPGPLVDAGVFTDVEAVAAADLIVGLSSMPMIQAYVLQKPVISLERLAASVSKETRQTHFHWDSDGTFTVARSFATLERILEDVARGRWRRSKLASPARSVLRDATGRAVRLLKRVVSQTCADGNHAPAQNGRPRRRRRR